MPCRCDDYETSSNADKIKDLETRLCRAQSVVKDLLDWDPVIRTAIPTRLLSRATRECEELARHKAAEAADEAKQRQYLESKVSSAKADLAKAEAELKRKTAPK
jgi:hypothetical protein